VESILDLPEIHGVLHEPEQTSGIAIALTHGAGSDCNAPLLVRLAQAFTAAGCLALRFDLPFRRDRKPPNPAQAVRDREGIAHVLRFLAARGPERIIAAGHSYGGRQSAMLAAEQPALATALLLLSYPLHPPQRPDQKRTSYFPELRTPALFVHGTKDPFGSIEELRSAIAAIPAATDLLAVEGAAHDLKRAADLSADILERLRYLSSTITGSQSE
jgi:uncharacterized protein